MEVISRSSLNPNAPSFIPIAYQQVEDFSEQWWELVNSSSWFQNYWLQECFQDPETNQNHYEDDDDSIFLPEIESVFDGYSSKQDEDDCSSRELVSLAAMEWRKSRGSVVERSPKYAEKAPKFVKLKMNPRAIQQPR